jgi:hypothetical protein
VCFSEAQACEEQAVQGCSDDYGPLTHTWWFCSLDTQGGWRVMLFGLSAAGVHVWPIERGVEHHNITFDHHKVHGQVQCCGVAGPLPTVTLPCSSCRFFAVVWPTPGVMGQCWNTDGVVGVVRTLVLVPAGVLATQGGCPCSSSSNSSNTWRWRVRGPQLRSECGLW